MKSVIKFFLYIRKSTDDKTGKRQVLSLDAQLRALRDLCRDQQLVIVGVIEESETAKKPGRPKFKEMLKRIERGEANGIMVWDIDRLYRNPADEGDVRWMLQQGIIACIKTPTRSYYPEDAGLLIAVEGGRATDFIIHHKRNVSRGIDEKLLRGEWPGQKPVGYIYDRNLRNIVPDRKHAKSILTIFEEVAAGNRGLVWTANRLAELGIVSKNGKTWSNSHVHHLLKNRLYTGVMNWGGKAYEGKYKPIVPMETFKRVQAVLKNRSKPRHIRKGHNFPFCGLFSCTCGSMISAQWAKGHGGLYRYYRCTRKGRPCKEPYTQEKFVLAQCLELLKPLAISTEDANEIRNLIDVQTQRENDMAESGVEQVTEMLSKVQAKMNKLTQGYLNELIDEESYQTAKIGLLEEKAALTQKKKRFHNTGASYWNEPSKEVINALEMAGKLQVEKSPQEISQLVQKIGTNRLLSRKTVTFSFSKPYDLIPSLLNFSPVTSLNTPTSLCDLNQESTNWCAL